MKQLRLLLFLVLAGCSAWAQNIVSTTITGTGCAAINVTGRGVVGISITNSGTAWSGTIQPEVAIGGDAAQNTTVTPYNSTTSQSTIVANGVYQSFVSGATTFLVCGNTVTNTAGVKLQVVNLSAGSGRGGGGSSFAGCTGVNGVITCTSGFVAQGATGFSSTDLNGGFVGALGTGAQAGFAVGNAGWYGDSTLNCLHFVVNNIDQGCGLSSELFVPSIDRSIGLTTGAMGAQSTATLTPITNMTWNLVASKNYSGWCEIPVTFAASATIAFGLVGPGTPTSYNLDAYGTIGAAAVYDDISLQAQTTWATTKTSASGAPGTSVTEVVHVNFQIQNGTTAGTLTLDTAANGTNAITIGANAVCHVMQLN